MNSKIFLKNLKIAKDAISTLTCVGSVFVVNLTLTAVTASELICSKSVTGEYEHTKDGCINQGTKIRIGFKYSDSKFIPYIDVCQDELKVSTKYTKHTLYGMSTCKSFKY